MGIRRQSAVGLDIGTTKICAIIGTEASERLTIQSHGIYPSAGLRKGIVVDADLAAVSIRQAVKEAGRTSGTRIQSVYAGIAGGHIKGFNGYAVMNIKGREIREEDIERLLDSAAAVCVPVDREILHVIPAGFRVDGHSCIRKPVGIYGEQIEANVHIVTGAVGAVQSLIRCCEIAGVDVADIILEPLASAEAVLCKGELERGVALIDIGGGTTDIAVYKDGILRHSAVLALGGNHITNDIAVGLGISVAEAEELKKAHGCAIAGMMNAGDQVAVGGENGKVRKIPRRILAEIIQPRCEELLMLVKKEIGSVSRGFSDELFHPQSITNTVLTGGTSLLVGLDVLASTLLNLPVRIGLPDRIGNTDDLNSPEYATGVGLVQCGLQREGRPELEKTLTACGIFERMKYWVRGCFTL